MAQAATILFAEDQAHFRDRMTAILEKHGFRVLLAADGIQAVANCRREQPDVLLLDLVMPHMDGLSVTRAVRGDRGAPYTPIILFSSRAQTIDRIAGLRAGADDFVGKDIDPDELIARLEALIRIRRLLEDQRRAGLPGATEDVSSDERGAPSEEVMQRVLQDEFKQSAENGHPLSVIIVAVEPSDDDARTVDLGDVSKRIASCVRGRDLVTRCRLRRAFAVIMPNAHFGGALAAAEQIWGALRPVADAGHFKDFPGVAVGVACYPNPRITEPRDLATFAYAALDRARAEGPAHICLHQHQAYIFRPV